VFRKPSDLAAHLDDVLAAKDRIACVWLQSGITDPAFEQALAEAGIKVVSNACLKVEHQQAAMASRM
jgi:predicted CoA-binding protein